MKESTPEKKQELFPGKQFLGQDGFGIVEVVLVLVIISVLAIFVAPEVGKWQPNVRLKGVARDFYANMQKAKLHAIRTNRTVNFTINATAICPGGSYLFQDDNVTAVTVAQVAVGAGDSKGVCLSATDAGVAGFDSRGGALGAGGNVTFTSIDTARVYKIGQSVAGGVVMEIQ